MNKDIQVGLPCNDELLCDIAGWLVAAGAILVMLAVFYVVWKEVRKSRSKSRKK